MKNEQGVRAASSCLSTLKMMAEEDEIKLWTPISVDPLTFNIIPMPMPEDKRTAFISNARKNYVKDLARAYEWIRVRENSDNVELESEVSKYESMRTDRDFEDARLQRNEDGMSFSLFNS